MLSFLSTINYTSIHFIHNFFKAINDADGYLLKTIIIASQQLALLFYDFHLHAILVKLVHVIVLRQCWLK